MKMVNTGDILERYGERYEVICSDDRTFVIAPRTENRTDYDNLEAYSNDPSIMTLDELNMKKVGRR